jgi:hypothetical protein
MKNIYYLFLIVPLFSFSQEIFTFKNGGTVLQNGIKISPDDLRAQFNQNQQIIDLYDAGRNKKTIGNVLLYGGITTLTTKLSLDLLTDNRSSNSNGSYQTERSSIGGYILGGILIVSAIPIKIGFSKKIRKAVELMNQEIITQKKTTFVESTSFIANSNGIGISLNF